MATTTSTTINLETLLETLRSATEEQRAEIAMILRASAAPAPSKKAAGLTGVGRPKKATLAPAPLPEVEDAGEAPEAADYRLPADSIREEVCVGRIITEANKDKRWSIAVYREAQCGGETLEDGDLCETCARRAEAYAATPKAGAWCGRVTEEPLPWMHMLGTAWAAAKIAEGKLKWRGEGAGDAASATGSESSAGGAGAAASTKAAEKAAAKAAKEAEKLAAKAAKEAEKAAKPKSAPKPKKAAAPAVTESTGAGGGAAAGAVPAKADAAAEVSATDGEIKYIGGETYWVRGDKVYGYDMITEAVGEFVGRLKADGETIDGDADEDSDEE